MSLLDLNFFVSYESTEKKSQLLEDFYIPLLENSSKYYRIAGFFSSSAISVAAKGIEGLIKNDGKMYLLISPEISEEDYRVIEAFGISEESSIFSDFTLGKMPDENLKALAWLLDKGKLEIKIVVGKKSRNSLFHQKIGIAFDDEGNIVSFSGSINETAQAWLNNIEEFKVFCSWEQGQVEYLKSDLTKFLGYWKNQRKDIAEVYDIPESIKTKLLEIKPRNIWDLNIMRRYNKDKKINDNKLMLFPHQEKAVVAWKKNNYSLLMEMATGTGKTRTAIGCIIEKLKEGEDLLIIVATPQNTLSRQWFEDFRKLNIKFDVEKIIDGSNLSWKKDLELILLDFSDKKIKTAIIFTTHDTASSDKFIHIIKENKYFTKILFIGDEVHAIGSAKQRNALLLEYEYRIGLSATPERLFDEGGTSLIRKYFGNKSFEFTIADALNTVNPITGEPFLNKYSYHPIFVTLTEVENKKYSKISQQIAILKSKDNYDPIELQRLYDRRAEVGKNAENKILALENLLDSMIPETIKDTIVFSSDKQIKRVFEILSIKKIKRAKVTENESASKIVNKQGDTERQEIISQFAQSQLQVIVGIKCLDEGIDIPNARVAILMSSSTNPREFVQRVGRVIRRSKGKMPSEIYDFIVLPCEGSSLGLLEKEARRAKFIAINATNYCSVKNSFFREGVDLDAN